MQRFTLIAILCAIAAIVGHSESTAEGDREIMRLQGPHWRITWTVAKAKLDDVSAWDSKKEPRLSPAKAVAIARAYLRSQGLPADRSVVAVDLRRPQKLDYPELYYFYYVDFDDLSRDDWPTIAARVVVLLDGSVVPGVRAATQ